MSPITKSFFYTWSLFDLRFGVDQETVGSCLLELMRSMQAPDEMLTVLENYCNSRMGIYEHLGEQAGKVRLRELVTGDEMLCHSTSGYLYDFGDCWEHKIELEDICAAETKAKYPRCTGGARACPPEDCGGIWGFYDFVEAMSDRKHPEHRELKEWHGGSFKPDAFDEQKSTREMR